MIYDFISSQLRQKKKKGKGIPFSVPATKIGIYIGDVRQKKGGKKGFCSYGGGTRTLFSMRERWDVLYTRD